MTKREFSTAPEACAQFASSLTRTISAATVARFAVYLRLLSASADAGEITVSSEQFASRAGVSSATLRKDLSCLGSNGVRGVGYDVIRLRDRLQLALGLESGHRVVVIGAGNLGRALIAYPGIVRRGFTVVGIFDVDPDLVGTEVAGLPVHHMDFLAATCRDLVPTIAIVTVPDASAQHTYDMLVDAGLRCILTFSAVHPDVPEHVEVRHVDLAGELQMLSFSGTAAAVRA